ncbi:MAG: SDR family NAD(P)-dependent oxidoreductase [Phycisphaeraceae bacterium]|nr:SDR family NAD(P)-dependent oxidoreductase [Phycisphaeraceae bacterium]MCB9847718.1 SDR family NAD(P)-dependent oxidoreductase [Phycisphaeraceae bacterium]
MPRIDLRDRSIVITGASSGIGRATAIECARAGMRVVAAARRPDRLDALVGAIHAQGGQAQPFVVDVRDADACTAMIEFTIDRFGACDTVFANAGVTLGKPTHETTDSQLRELFEINVFGSMNAVRPAVHRMIERGSGHLLFCSSVLALLSVPNHGAYTATKAAQHHLARAIRAELHGTGVHVSTVHPIGTRTELFEAAANKHGQYLAHDPPKWLTQSPERVARAVLRCLKKPRPEVWTSQPARLAAALSNATPRLTDAIVRRAMKPEQ